MNKGIKEKILEHMPEKISRLRQLGKKNAESDFTVCCDNIEKGNFILVDTETIKVFALNAGTADENAIYKKAYDDIICTLFTAEDIEVIGIRRGYSACASLFLKI